MTTVTEKWIAGTVGLTWATVMSTELNSIVNGNAILASSALDNSSNLDMFADFSLHLASATFAAPNYVGIFLYPLNDDASTYGDGRFGSSAAMTAANAPVPYWVGNIPFPTGTAANNGMLRGILLPPGSFKPVLWNNGGVTLASSGNTLKWRTYDRSLA